MKFNKNLISLALAILTCGGLCSNLPEVFAQKNYSVKSSAVQEFGKKKKKNRSSRRRVKRLKKLNQVDNRYNNANYNHSTNYAPVSYSKLSPVVNNNLQGNYYSLPNEDSKELVKRCLLNDPVVLNVIYGGDGVNEPVEAAVQSVRLYFSLDSLRKHGYKLPDVKSLSECSLEIIDKETGSHFRRVVESSPGKLKTEIKDIPLIAGEQVGSNSKEWNILGLGIDGNGFPYSRGESISSGFNFKVGKKYAVRLYYGNRWNRENSQFSAENLVFEIPEVVAFGVPLLDNTQIVKKPGLMQEICDLQLEESLKKENYYKSHPDKFVETKFGYVYKPLGSSYVNFPIAKTSTSQKKLMVLSVQQVSSVDRQVVQLYFSPTYLIEKFGLNKYEDFSKFSVEIVDKSTGAVLRHVPEDGGDFDSMVGCPDVHNDLLTVNFVVKSSKVVGFKAYIEPGFKFEVGGNYKVNFYRNGSFDENSLVVSCDVVGEKREGVPRDVAHPDGPTMDYYEHFGLGCNNSRGVGVYTFDSQSKEIKTN